MQQYAKASLKKPFAIRPRVLKLKSPLEVVATSKVLASFKLAKARIDRDKVVKQKVKSFIRKFKGKKRPPLVHGFLPGLLIIHNIESS